MHSNIFYCVCTKRIANHLRTRSEAEENITSYQNDLKRSYHWCFTKRDINLYIPFSLIRYKYGGLWFICKCETICHIFIWKYYCYIGPLLLVLVLNFTRLTSFSVLEKNYFPWYLYPGYCGSFLSGMDWLFMWVLLWVQVAFSYR